MARENKPVTKLGAKHLIGYGAGDAGGVCMLMMVSTYLERFSRNILGVAPGIFAAILVIECLGRNQRPPGRYLHGLCLLQG